MSEFRPLTGETVTDDELRKLRRWATKLTEDVGIALLRGEPGEIKSQSLLDVVKAARDNCAGILELVRHKL